MYAAFLFGLFDSTTYTEKPHGGSGGIPGIAVICRIFLVEVVLAT